MKYDNCQKPFKKRIIVYHICINQGCVSILSGSGYFPGKISILPALTAGNGIYR